MIKIKFLVFKIIDLENVIIRFNVRIVFNVLNKFLSRLYLISKICLLFYKL